MRTRPRPLRLRTAGTACVALVAALALAGCGGGGSSSSSSSSNGASADVISVATVSGTKVLVDSKGNTLYVNDQDGSGKSVCTGSCTAIWKPAAKTGNEPTDATLAANLGTIKRPDGKIQIAYMGKPLYTFTQEGSGQLTGDGLSDSFGGTSFTWHAATSSGAASSSGSGGSSTSASPSSPPPQSNYGY